VLRRKFGHKREEVEGSWRRLHTVELQILYASPNFIAVLKSWGMISAEHVVRTG